MNTTMRADAEGRQLQLRLDAILNQVKTKITTGEWQELEAALDAVTIVLFGRKAGAAFDKAEKSAWAAGEHELYGREGITVKGADPWQMIEVERVRAKGRIEALEERIRVLEAKPVVQQFPALEVGK